MSDPIDPAAVMTEHSRVAYEEDDNGEVDEVCAECSGAGWADPWPCLPYRLASALFSEQAKVARVVEMAHRFEIVPRARLLGALTAKAKP